MSIDTSISPTTSSTRISLPLSPKPSEHNLDEDIVLQDDVDQSEDEEVSVSFSECYWPIKLTFHAAL